MDIFRLTERQFLIEYEVKTSRADFLADFKKNEGKKHNSIQAGMLANRFFFVVPEGLISENEVPSYAGLIYVKERCLEVVKSAKLIHRKPFNTNDYILLAQKLSWRERIFRDKTRQLKRKVDELENRLIAEYKKHQQSKQ